VTCHGVLAPGSSLRPAIVPSGGARRGLEVLRWPTCGGRRRILAAITLGAVIRALLSSLGLPTGAPVVASARSPPELPAGEAWG
jgi:hypothetical protein